MKILITGKPGIGKTTIIKQLAEKLGDAATGFYTEEIREAGKRVGFKIVTLSGDEGILAHINVNSRFRVSKYKVNLGDLESIAVAELKKGLAQGKTIIIDEIGKMELFSTEFKKVVKEIFESELPVICTIMYKRNPFSDAIKGRAGVKLVTITTENRDSMGGIILTRLAR